MRALNVPSSGEAPKVSELSVPEVTDGTVHVKAAGLNWADNGVAAGDDLQDDEALRSVLESARTVAIVGLSTDPGKPSSTIARILIDAGYEVIPVHPTATEILGRKAYPTLAEVPVPVDIVDVFRPPHEAARIAHDAVAIGASTLWLQLGITSDEARTIAEDAGLDFVENTCIGATTVRLGNTAKGTK